MLCEGSLRCSNRWRVTLRTTSASTDSRARSSAETPIVWIGCFGCFPYRRVGISLGRKAGSRMAKASVGPPPGGPSPSETSRTLVELKRSFASRAPGAASRNAASSSPDSNFAGSSEVAYSSPADSSCTSKCFRIISATVLVPLPCGPIETVNFPKSSMLETLRSSRTAIRTTSS